MKTELKLVTRELTELVDFKAHLLAGGQEEENSVFNQANLEMGSRTPKERAENPSNKWVLQAGATSPNAMSRLKELLAIEEGDNRLTKLFPDEH